MSLVGPGFLMALSLWAPNLPQEPNIGRPAEDGETVSERRRELERELATEREALERLRSDQSAQLDELRATRRDLAQELLEKSLEEERGRAAAEALALEAVRWEGELEQRLGAVETVQGAAQTALERLGFSAAGLPGRAELARGARTAAELLAEEQRRLPTASALLESASEDALEQSTFEPEALGGLGSAGKEAARSVFSSFDTALSDAVQARVFEARIVDADGREKRAQILSAGWIAFAYRSQEGHIGLALASPLDASGYRWSEDLDPETGAMLSAAFDAIAGGREALFPIDPTGQVRPEALGAQEGLDRQLIAGGPLMIPLALVALAALVLASERFFTLFLRNRRAHGLAREVLRAAGKGHLEQAVELCARGTGILSRTLNACLSRAAQGQAAMEDAIQEQLLNELPRLNRFLRTLAILASVAPLIGLLGTVTGIIQTFGVIKALGSTDPTSMAGGISVALVTTAVGLVIAIPTLLIHGLLKGRGDRLIADAERYAATLLTLLVHGPEVRMQQAGEED